MKRDIEQDLLTWKNQSNRLPLLLRGARQVGKSYIVEKFGRENFETMVLINFELHPELIDCFTSLEPADILNKLVPLVRQKIEPGTTLLFLDEIQDCPNAIRALRYFKEKLPDLHVIGAGSLLEFTLNNADFRMPVGRVQSLYLKPLSFKEYLTALGYADLRQEVEKATVNAPVSEPLHSTLLSLIRQYIVLGGMPAVLQDFVTQHDVGQCMNIQTALLNTYRQDFGKYAKKSDYRYLQRLFEKIPGLIAEHFKYSKVDPDMRSRDIKEALEMLSHAGIIYPVYATAGSGLPLVSLMNEKKFKILFLDVGLVSRSSRMEANLLLSEDVLLVNRGSIAEQFVGQELLAYGSRFDEEKIFFWVREKRSSMAEVDFVAAVDSTIIPIEVKAGMTGRLKSLRVFMDEMKSDVGLRISQVPLSMENKILSVPLYMIGEIKRLIN